MEKISGVFWGHLMAIMIVCDLSSGLSLVLLFTNQNNKNIASFHDFISHTGILLHVPVALSVV